MNSLFQSLLYHIGRCFFIYRLSINNRFVKVCDIIYTGSISKGFKLFGNSSVIKRKMDCLINPCFISIGGHTTIGKRLVLTAWKKREENPQICIGHSCQLGDDAHITAINKIIIGDNVLIGKKVTITDNSHGDNSYKTMLLSPLKRECVSKGSVIIENCVWIGDKVTILPNVRIGHNAIIGANAVVTKDIPPFAVAAGNPAKVIKLLDNTD